jgi:hypothetical protein
LGEITLSYRFTPNSVVVLVPASGQEMRPSAAVIERRTVGADGRLVFAGAEWGLFSWGQVDWGTALTVGDLFWAVGEYDSVRLELKMKAVAPADEPIVQSPILPEPWPRPPRTFGRL